MADALIASTATEQMRRRMRFLWAAAQVYTLACPSLACNLMHSLSLTASANNMTIHSSISRHCCGRCGAIRLPGINGDVAIAGTRRTTSLHFHCRVCNHISVSDVARKQMSIGRSQKNPNASAGQTATMATKQKSNAKKLSPGGKPTAITSFNKQKGAKPPSSQPKPIKHEQRQTMSKNTTKKRGLAALLDQSKRQTESMSMSRLKLEDFLSSVHN